MGVRLGRYETLYPLASGGMATVHLARAMGAGGFERLVAIKVMHPGLGEDGDFAAMFLDEARVAARIRHPNVVSTLDVQEGPEGLFLVMEYVEGPSLFALGRALAKKKRGFPAGIALRIVIDALLGLHAAHEQTGPSGEPLNIVHRDVSPQNILVSVDGQIKITDFGVARAEARLSSTRRGEVKGKLAYMSPQQVRAEPLDRRADVYAAGVVLWELCTGERLFSGDNDGALVVSVMAGAQRSLRDLDPKVPAPLDRECMRALRIDPNERHPTALAFAEALEIAAEEAGITLASARVVAAFVKELGAHKPVEVPPAADAAFAPRPAPGSPSWPGGGSPSRPGIGAPPAMDDEPPTRVAASSPGHVPVAPAPADANSQVASVLTSPAAPFAPPPRSPMRIAAMAVAVAVLGIAAVLGTRLLTSTPDPSPAAQPPLAPSATVAVATAQPAITASATASAAAEPPKAQASSQPSASARPKAGPAAPAVKTPRSGASEWKPSGL